MTGYPISNFPSLDARLPLRGTSGQGRGFIRLWIKGRVKGDFATPIKEEELYSNLLARLVDEIKSSRYRELSSSKPACLPWVLRPFHLSYPERPPNCLTSYFSMI